MARTLVTCVRVNFLHDASCGHDPLRLYKGFPALFSGGSCPARFQRCVFLAGASLALSVGLARAQAVSTPAKPPVAAATAPETAAGFDVVSIHQNKTATDGRHHIYNNPGESHFRTVNLSLEDLLQLAYGLPKSQIFGGPSWLNSTMYDIDAKSDPSVDARLYALPSDQARHQKQLMVQALLTDRFQLVVHNEVRHLPVYELVVTKGGPKFKPSEINGTTIDSGRSRMHIAGSDDTLAILARELAQVLGHAVLNDTGLTGRYDLTLRWTPDDAVTPEFNAADPNPAPDIFTAIQEQLGLKLKFTKGPVPVLVIDRVAPPSAN